MVEAYALVPGAAVIVTQTIVELGSELCYIGVSPQNHRLV